MNIIEFAKQLNISPSTVSRAFNDRAEVSLKTREMVLEKAKELGFSPNANARRLVTGRNFMIRLECPHITHVLSDYYLVELARYIENSAGSRGYGLMLSLGNPRRYSFDIQPVDGLIVVGASGMPESDLSALTYRGTTPAVVIGERYPQTELGASFICIDTIPGAREAVQRLAALGHRRIGYVGSGQSTNPVRAALPTLMVEAGIAWEPTLAMEAGVRQADGFRAARELLSQPSPPTALFCRTDVLAMGAIQAAHHLGLSVPQDVSIVGHDNLEVGALTDPPLTTVAIDIPDVAEAAVGALLAMVEQNAAPIVIARNTHLVIRSSCGPAPTAK